MGNFIKKIIPQEIRNLTAGTLYTDALDDAEKNQRKIKLEKIQRDNHIDRVFSGQIRGF